MGVRQHTQDVCCCPSAHTGRPWLSLCVRVCPWVSANTHRTSVAVHGCPSAHTGRPWLFVCVRVCPCLSIRTHRTSVAVHHTHISMLVLGLSTLARPKTPTNRPKHWSISTHISTLVLGLNTLALPVDCLCDFGPRGLSVQYTQDIRGCPPVHT